MLPLTAMEDLAVKAFVFGLISAASLPLGALTAMFWRSPRARVVASMMAFGAGALLAALTIELVAETVRKGHFYWLALGMVAGGVLFVVLNQVVNDRGGFLRKAATTITYLRKKRLQHYEYLLSKLSRVTLFQQLPPAELQTLLPFIASRRYRKGEVLIRQGEPGDRLFIIEEGAVDIVSQRSAPARIATLRANDVLGEMALVTGQPRSATAVAVADTRVWVIFKSHFDALLHTSPLLADAVKNLVTNRITELQDKSAVESEKAEQWRQQAIQNIDAQVAAPTVSDIQKAAAEHHGAPLAIWLGILLDGIPESVVIGSSLLLHNTVSLSLLAGLFLSNYPEALSSSVGMREQKYSYAKILGMWTSLMVITGIGAFLGNVFFASASHSLFALVDGLAAGAMLAMIAETMLPEAYHKGGAVTGLSTLAGFLAAVFFKTLQH